MRVCLARRIAQKMPKYFADADLLLDIGFVMAIFYISENAFSVVDS